MALLIEAAQQGIAHGGRLVVDFLFHEGIKAALFRSGGIPLDFKRLALCRVALIIGNFHFVRGDGHNLVVVHLHGRLGVINKAGYIGAEEVLALAQADNQRGVAASGNNAIGLLGVDG